MTPDSFSDGDGFFSVDAALEQASRMVEEGAAFIDVGGESTRPGAEVVSADEELRRVIPVIETLVSQLDIPVSIDTSKPVVMREAVAAGAGFINDVCALQEPGAVEVAVELGIPVCIMHMQGNPRVMQDNPQYDDVIGAVMSFFHDRVQVLLDAGVQSENIVVDPGFCFGKSLVHNQVLLRELGRFQQFGLPVLVGLSRKSMVGEMIGRDVAHRLYGSLAAAIVAFQNGAQIIRCHDVGPTVDALNFIAELKE